MNGRLQPPQAMALGSVVVLVTLRLVVQKVTAFVDHRAEQLISAEQTRWLVEDYGMPPAYPLVHEQVVLEHGVGVWMRPSDPVVRLDHQQLLLRAGLRAVVACAIPLDRID